ncbi:MAG: zinc-dependent metalloprotease [Candidatus Nanopelagicales bacterium]
MSGNLPFGFGLGGDDSTGGNPFGGAGNPFDMNSLGAALQNLGQMLQQGGTGDSGPVNWPMVTDVARKAIGTDPSIGDSERRAVIDSVRLADVWLDQATTFPATVAEPRAWSRAEWLEGTIPAWRRIVEPIATSMSNVMSSQLSGTDLSNLSPEDLEAALPEQMRGMFPGGVPAEMMQMLAPMMGMMQQLGAVAFSMQLGQALAGLAGDVVSLGDIGIPLTDDSVPTLLPRNVAEFGEGIGVDADDVRLYLALRESAHQRLFAHVAWLRPRIVGAIEEYSRGITIDPSQLSEQMNGIDPSNPEAMQELMASGLLKPQDTEEQRAALARLETLLALVEGWVDDVVEAAIGDRLPSSSQVRETVRRRRAAGGPAEKTFSTLVGLELRPRALREAANLFAAVRHSGGAEGRDALWGHPDLLPSADDLSDPLGFVERSNADLDFDA